MFPTATLLHEQQHGRRDSVVLLAFLVKNVAGPPQQASMIETLWGKTCAQFGAENYVNEEDVCKRMLKNSSRELMCNSVLGQQTTDVGKVLLGEFCPMRTLPTSVLPSSFRSFCRYLEKVSIDFLLEQKHLGDEYLRHGYFRIFERSHSAK